MKNIRSNIIAAGILCLSLGMTSCTKGFLDVESKTESTTGNFYKLEFKIYTYKNSTGARIITII